MLSNHLILCCPLLLLPSIFPSFRVFFQRVSLPIRWPKYWSFNISPSSEYSGLISSRIDWFDLLTIQGILKSLLQHRNSKASTFWLSAFFSLNISPLAPSPLPSDLPYMITKASKLIFLLLLFFFFFWPLGCGILILWPEIEPVLPSVEVWSHNHQSAREVPCCFHSCSPPIHAPKLPVIFHNWKWKAFYWISLSIWEQNKIPSSFPCH